MSGRVVTAVIGKVLIAFAHRAEKSKKAVSKAFQPIVISSDDEDEDEDDDDDENDDVEATPMPKSKTAGRRWGARVVVCAVEVLTYRDFLRQKQSSGGGETPVSRKAGGADRRGHRRAAGGGRHEGQHHGLVRGRGGGRG